MWREMMIKEGVRLWVQALEDMDTHLSLFPGPLANTPYQSLLFHLCNIHIAPHDLPV